MKIIIEKIDGSVTVMTVLNGDPEGCIEQWKQIHGAEYVAHHIAESLPQDRKHRDAWVWEGGKVKVHAGKAAAIDEKRANGGKTK